MCYPGSSLYSTCVLLGMYELPSGFGPALYVVLLLPPPPCRKKVEVVVLERGAAWLAVEQAEVALAALNKSKVMTDWLMHECVIDCWSTQLHGCCC